MSHLPEHVVKSWVSGFGVPVPRGVTVTAPEAVESAASGLTPPLVVKAYGPGLVHKSDSGAVRLHLDSSSAAGAAAEKMLASLAAQGITPEGFLVEEQAEAGVEVIVGAVQDPAFGPVVLVGLGGVWTEVLHDTALRLAPLGPDDASAMLDELRGRALLDGYRGQPRIDRAALTNLIVSVSEIAEALSALEGHSAPEFELNPVICRPDGVIAVDARLLNVTSFPPSDPPPSAGLGGSGGGTASSGALGGRGARVGAVSGGRAAVTDVTRLFEPRGVAVVGASTKRPNFGNMFLGFYKASGFGGKLVAVHPEAEEIDGVPCIRSLAEAEGIDYALVAVPAKQCADVVRQAAGIPFVQVMSGGFREMGAPELEEDLVKAAAQAGVRLLGPNCMGVYSPKGGQTFIGGKPGSPWRIAAISQSGGMAGEVIKVGEQRGLRFSRVATVGNSADITPAELLRSFAADPDTSAVGLYLEDPRDGRGLFETLRDIRLPVVALVGGRSKQGQKAAASHTGGMVNDTRIWDALSAQTGMTIVKSQDDLIGVLDFYDLHARRNVPGSSEILVIGPSGGASVLAADVFDAAGLQLATLPEQTMEALRGLGLGAGSSLANPLEIPVGPRGNPDLVRQAVHAIVSERPYADVVTHVNVQSFFTFGNSADPLIAYTKAVGVLQEELPTTRVTLVMRNAESAPAGVEEAVRETARAAGIPVYRSMEAAAVAIAAGKTYARRVDGTA